MWIFTIGTDEVIVSTVENQRPGLVSQHEEPMLKKDKINLNLRKGQSSSCNPCTPVGEMRCESRSLRTHGPASLLCTITNNKDVLIQLKLSSTLHTCTAVNTHTQKKENPHISERLKTKYKLMKEHLMAARILKPVRETAMTAV